MYVPQCHSLLVCAYTHVCGYVCVCVVRVCVRVCVCVQYVCVYLCVVYASGHEVKWSCTSTCRSTTSHDACSDVSYCSRASRAGQSR